MSRDHRCDTGHFSRIVCPEPCDTMHSYCSVCDERQDPCWFELTPEEAARLPKFASLQTVQARGIRVSEPKPCEDCDRNCEFCATERVSPEFREAFNAALDKIGASAADRDALAKAWGEGWTEAAR